MDILDEEDSEEQIVFALKQAENGATIDEICRMLGIVSATLKFLSYQPPFG